MRICIYLCLLISLFVNFGCNPFIKQEISVREPSYAGSFYPKEQENLRQIIQGFLSAAKNEINFLPRALIVPHAGYVYSGATAAYAYTVLELNPNLIKRIIILAPSHRVPLQGMVINKKSYKTPLGTYETDVEAINLLEKEGIKSITASDPLDKEHSDEVQLPFIQTVLPQAKLVPIIVGNNTSAQLLKNADALSKIIDDETVILASSDFTHYGASFNYQPNFSTSIKEGIFNLDHDAIDLIIKGKTNQFQKYIHEKKATICGSHPITLLLKIFELKKWETSGQLLHYSTSGDRTSDWNHSVSYASISLGVLKKNSKTKGSPMLLNEKEQKTLLSLSRHVLTSFIKDNTDSFDESKFDLSEKLKQVFGLFVTLKHKGRLRGCIGHIEGVYPLFKGIIQNTINAAANDHRFSKVQASELDDIEIEISVLTPLTKINNLDEVIVGKTGLVLKNGRNVGVFLPQVPTEQNWDKTTYLEQLGRKAGLSLNAYKDDNTTLYGFTAFVFHEKENH